jgi:ABC-2 type transport system ATP-binding protein
MELVIENISKTYGNDVHALKNVSLTIPTGMFGLLGPNGSGKTTLMRSIATLQEVDCGSIRLNGLDVLKQKEDVRRVLGYLPQEFGLYPSVTALRLLSHLAFLKGITGRRERSKTVALILRQTNLWDDRNRKLGTFSGGMKQRFGVAQALLGKPQIIIVDEPTAGLDPEERNRFLNLLSEIGENVVVILSTHIVEDVSELCTNMAIIEEGEVRYTGSPQTAIDTIRGKTWRTVIDRAQLPAYEQKYQIISRRLAAGQTLLHVLAEEQPDPSFEPVQPDLRDVYFSILAQPEEEL